jgi:4-carboxymuconolactone decarboxylase
MGDPYAHLERAGGETFARIMPGIESDPRGVAALGRTVLFGDVWNRPHLSVRDRRLITLTVLGLTGGERVTRLHVRAALRSGDLSPDELDAFLVHFGFYAGFPRGSALNGLVQDELEAFRRERDPA